MVQEYVDGKYKQLILMNNCDIPEWFHFKSTNNSITFPTTFNYPGWKLKVLAACVKVQVHDPVNGYHRGGDLECEVFFKDILVWSSGDWTNYLGYDSRWLPLGASPSEYTWFIVLNPHRDFSLDDWDDMMERSPETDLSQLCFGINSMEMDRNRSNDKWNSIGGSIWKNFTVLFEPRPLSRDTIISIKGCGVHVIME